jgi:hypothetical protein
MKERVVSGGMSQEFALRELWTRGPLGLFLRWENREAFAPRAGLGKAIAPKEGAWKEKSGAAAGSDVGNGWGSEGTEHTKLAEHDVLSSVNQWIVCV